MVGGEAKIGRQDREKRREGQGINIKSCRISFSSAIPTTTGLLVRHAYVNVLFTHAFTQT